MSDTKLRELERRWRETGSVEDEAAYLLERVRLGGLPRERVEFAAYCGHAASRQVIGDRSIVPAAERVLAGITAKRWGTAMSAEALRAALEVCGAAFEKAGELTPPHRTVTALGEVQFTAQRLDTPIDELAAATLRHLWDRVLTAP